MVLFAALVALVTDRKNNTVSQPNGFFLLENHYTTLPVCTDCISSN